MIHHQDNQMYPNCMKDLELMEGYGTKPKTSNSVHTWLLIAMWQPFSQETSHQPCPPVGPCLLPCFWHVSHLSSFYQPPSTFFPRPHSLFLGHPMKIQISFILLFGVTDLSLYPPGPLRLNPESWPFSTKKVHQDIYFNKTTSSLAINYATLLKSEKLHSVFVFNSSFSFWVNKTEKKALPLTNHTAVYHSG